MPETPAAVPYQGRYASMGDLREQVQVEDVVDDAALERALKAAEDQIDRHCRRGADGGPRPFNVPDVDDDDPEVRYFDPTGHRWTVDDLVAVDEIAVGWGSQWETLTVDEHLELAPLNAAAGGRPFTSVVPLRSIVGRRLRVTGWFGWPALPDVVVQAALLQASRLVQRRNAALGVAMVPAFDGNTGMRLLSKLDPDVELLLLDVRRNTVLV